MRRWAVVLGTGTLLWALAAACLPDYQFATSGALEGGPNDEAGADGPADGPQSSDAPAEGTVVIPPFDAAGTSRLDPLDSGRFTFTLDYSGGGPAQLSAPLTHAFAIDQTEVSVGRYNAWLLTNKLPSDGESLDPGGPYAQVMKWHSVWESKVVLPDCGEGPGSYGTPSTLERDASLPASCVTWYAAVAFCASEGKRLPTELEWQFTVTSGGRYQYLPWTMADEPPATLDCDHLIFDLGAKGADGGGCNFPNSGPALLGKTDQGVLDMAGRLFEWVWDTGASFPMDAGPNYAGPLPGDPSIDVPRVRRGGAFNSDVGNQHFKNWYRNPDFKGGTHFDDLGFRCARTLLQ